MQIPADLVTFTEEIFYGKLHFLCSATSSHIQTYSYSYFQKVFTRRFLISYVIPQEKYYKSVTFFLKLSGVIWANMALRSGYNAYSFI